CCNARRKSCATSKNPNSRQKATSAKARATAPSERNCKSSARRRSWICLGEKFGACKCRGFGACKPARLFYKCAHVQRPQSRRVAVFLLSFWPFGTNPTIHSRAGNEAG